MVLADNQAARGCQFDLRVVGKYPCAGGYYVSLQAQRGFVNLVPDGERNARFVFLLSRCPSG